MIEILSIFFPCFWTPRTIVQTLLVTRTLWGRCDLLSLILPYFGSLYYYHHCPRGLVELSFCRAFSNLTSSSSHHSHPHPADIARLARHPRLAVLLLTPCVNRWILWLLSPLLLFLLLYTLLLFCCFTDKSFSFEPLVSFSPCSDKLVAP